MHGPKSMALALSALVLVAITSGPVTAAPKVADDPNATSTVEESADPLAVTIDTMSPAVIPKKGKLRISGTITNTTGERWTAINVYPLTSHAPMQTIEELDAAAKTDPDLPVGERILSVSEHITALDPGQSAPYSLAVPRTALNIDENEGVYWLLVQALGHSPSDEDPSSDGKARTFIPLVGKRSQPEEVALIGQVRRRVPHRPDGQIAAPATWMRDLDTGGRLRSVLDLATAARGQVMNWVVDPAVFDALDALAVGNPARVTPLTPYRDPDETTTSPTPAPDVPNPLAGEWVRTFVDLTAADQLLSLPYGDLDVAAASRVDSDLLAKARQRATRTWEQLDLQTHPVLVSPNGVLSPAAIAAADGAVPVVTSEALGLEGPAHATVAGTPVLVASSGAVAGGAGPDDPTSAVSMRQRLLSEAAVRAVSSDAEPLVALLPADWQPEDPDEFFAGLDVKWVDFVSVADLVPSADSPVLTETDLDYPDTEAEQELPTENLSAADTLISRGDTLRKILVDDTGVGDSVLAQALTGVSYWERPNPTRARTAAVRATSNLAHSLDAVSLQTRRSLTLSSNSGIFPVGVHNRLDVPVRVRLVARSADDITITGGELLTVAPGDTQVVRLTAKTTQVGVYNVAISVTAPDGTPLPQTVYLPVRSNQVSSVIWVMMAIGGAILFGAIGLRLARRIGRTRGRGAPA